MKLDDLKGRRSPAALATGQEVLNVVIEYPEFKQALAGCLSLIHSLQTLSMPSGILILAEPGMGKTLLLQRIRAHLQRSAAMSMERCHLEISLDSAVDTHRMAAAMMLALGYPMLPSRPNLDNMNHMVGTGLDRKRPVALLLDEMQHICEGNRDITARAVTDWLKVRMDRHNLPIIGAGTKALERLNLINPQFTSRASATFSLSPFTFGDAWRQLLAAFAEQVTQVNLDIVNHTLSRAIHTSTKGNLRATKRLLTYACMYTAERDARIVSKEDFAEAFRDANGSAPDRVNPFV